MAKLVIPQIITESMDMTETRGHPVRWVKKAKKVIRDIKDLWVSRGYREMMVNLDLLFPVKKELKARV